MFIRLWRHISSTMLPPNISNGNGIPVACPCLLLPALAFFPCINLRPPLASRNNHIRSNNHLSSISMQITEAITVDTKFIGCYVTTIVTAAPLDLDWIFCSCSQCDQRLRHTDRNMLIKFYRFSRDMRPGCRASHRSPAQELTGHRPLTGTAFTAVQRKSPRLRHSFTGALVLVDGGSSAFRRLMKRFPVLFAALSGLAPTVPPSCVTF